MKTIYCFKNTKNNKYYVGISVNAPKRKKQHEYTFHSGNYGKGNKLYRAMKKHGIKTFEFVILERCRNSIVHRREFYWIEKFDSCNNGYNCTNVWANN